MENEDQQDLREALKAVAVALKESGLPFALMGGYAAWARGGPEPDHDVDFLVAEEDAHELEHLLADRGFTVEQPPEDWLFKVFVDGSMIDVIFRVCGQPAQRSDVERATVTAIAELDTSFFRVRFDRLTQSEKRYLRAMAELGPGPHRSGDIADALDAKVQAVAPVRAALIGKGMVYSPTYGETAFTVPLFDEFMRRALPWP